MEAVPPLATVRVPEERVPLAEALTAPVPRDDNLTVDEANSVPKKGEEEALKKWIDVPSVLIAKGPFAWKVWEAAVRASNVVMPVPLVAPMQVPFGRQTFPVPSIWIPPENVEVAVGLKLIDELPDCREKRVPGEVVPTPRLPVSANLPASVSKPERRVEKIRLLFPVREFWVRREISEEVVVAAPVKSRVWKESWTDVLVAEDKLARVRGVEVAWESEEVAVIAPKVGEVVAERVKV